MPSYTVTESQKQQLLRDGYVNLPAALPPELLTRLRSMAETLEAKALRIHQNRDNQRPKACVIEDVKRGPMVFRYDDIIEEDPDAVLDLLACPALLAVARDLCGKNCVPLQIDILYKYQYPGADVIWHQGAPHPRGYPYLNIGVYLDDADALDGCLRYVPATQGELQDICGLSEKHGWDVPGFVEQPTQAGDILVQDMMILHGSLPKRSEGVRRTIYIEFRTYEGILESGRQSEAWARLRQRWMGLVLRRAEADAWPKAWMDAIPQDLGSDEEEIAKIMSLWEPPIPAVYCHYSVVTENYPVPADLKAMP